MQTADQRAERTLQAFLPKGIGPSKAMEELLSGYAKIRTKTAYAMELRLYMRWLHTEGVALGWDDLPRDNLERVYGSGPTDVEKKRTHLDWMSAKIPSYNGTFA